MGPQEDALPVSPADTDASFARARLLEAAQGDQAWELILVLRGKVRHVRGRREGLWSVRVGGRLVTFSADCLLAATRLPRRPRRGPDRP
jgi:hypothetical protein